VRWRFAAVGGLAVAAVIAVTLIPRVSPASAALGRMETALANVRTMSAETFIHFGDPREERAAMRWTYANGVWRLDSRLGSALERSTIVRHGTMYVYSKRHHTVVAEPYQGWFGATTTALEFAKEQTNYGLIGEDRTLRVEDAPPEGGRHTYRIVMERKSDQYHTEILVDRATDLPIRSLTHMRLEGGVFQNIRIEYGFGNKIRPTLLDPGAFGSPILDLPTAHRQLLARYRRPLAEAGTTALHDVEVAPDGTVFALVSLREEERGLLPDTLEDGSRTRYLRLPDLQPGGNWGDTRVRESFRIGDRLFLVTTWVPLEPGRRPGPLRFGFSRRGLYAPGKASRPPMVESVTVVPDRIARATPAYSTALLLDDPFVAQRIAAAEARADWYRDAGDFESELEWRWAQHRAGVAYVRRFGELQVPALAKCLESLGRTAEAAKVRRELGPRPIKRYP
jgi:hypothetical protein